MLRTTLIIQAIVAGVHYKVIHKSVNVTTDIIGLLSERNGTARKGPYKGCYPPRIPNPLVTDINVKPASEVTLDWNEKQNNAIAKRAVLEKTIEDVKDDEEDLEDDVETVDDEAGSAEPDIDKYFSREDSYSEEPIVSFQDRLDFACTNVVDLLNGMGIGVDEIKILTTQGHIFSHKS
jgi:hypothetical protein